MGFALLLLVAAASAAGQELRPETPVSGTIRDGENHSFAVRAEAGQFAWLTLSMKNGMVVSFGLFGPDGSKLAASSHREIFVVVPASATYRVSLQGQGEYVLTFRALRTPSAADNRRVAAFGATIEASALLERRPKNATVTRQAVTRLLEALPVWRELGAPYWEGWAGHDLGNAYLYLQELEKAKKVLLDALPLRRATGDPRLAALTLSTLAAVVNDLGDFRDAVRYGEEALPLRREAGDRKGEANTLNNLAFAYNRLNERDRGLELNLQALAIRREIGDREGLALALGNLAVAYRFMGLAEKGLTMGAEALAVARDLGDDQAIADALRGLGLSHSLLGDARKAHGYWSEAVPLYERIGDSFGLSSAYVGLGSANAQLRRHAEAIRYYDQSLALRRKSGNAQGQASSLLALCSLHGKTGEAAKAGTFGDEALVIARRLGVKQSIGRSLRCLGDLDRQAGRWEQARAGLTEAVETFRSSRAEAVDLSMALSSLAAVEMQLGNLRKALEILKEAQGLVEAERTGLSGDLRASLRASRGELYAMEVDVLMQLHRSQPDAGFAAKALAANERSRARTLIETIADADFDPRERMTPEQSRKEAELQARIADARARKSEAAAGKAERELELHQIAVRGAAVSAFAKAQYEGTLGPEEIQRELLGGGQALVEYVLGETRSYVFVLTARGLTAAELPGRMEIENQVTAYRRELAQSVTELTAAAATPRWAAASRRMYKLLLAPVESELLGGKELIVVPDGVLAHVPFETLIGAAPLIETFAVGYAPSASTLAELRKRAARGESVRMLLALGDPVYGPASGGTDRGLEWTPLPNTRGEVNAIGALFLTKEQRVYVGAAASKGRLKNEDLLPVRFLHVAAHGFVDVENPARSGLVLSDGVLEVSEILRLRLRAEIVTLSACQTGLGQVLAGEGVLGLSRAFLFAGAGSTVVSLWNVNDAATAELMKAFYGNLRRGMAPPEALRQSKLRLAKGARRSWRHPYFWAPFVFIGGPA